MKKKLTKAMRKKSKVKVSTAKHSGKPHGGMPMPSVNPAFANLKKPVQMSGRVFPVKGSTKTRKRTKGGGMQKTGDPTRVWKPFMA